MTKRPLPVTIIAWLFITAGIVGVAYHVTEINIHDLFAGDLLLALFIRLLAIIGGIFTLRRANWARRILLVWTMYHAVLSFFHPLPELAMHTVLLVVTAYILFNPNAAAYFKNAKEK